MDFRAAVEADIGAIAAFTTGTFEWGDYVPYAVAEWIDADDSVVMVAVEDGDVPIAIGRCVLLTSQEAWLHAARVNPSHRGRGIAGIMAVVLTDWARTNGALVARLLIEDDNTASIAHINKTAFRRTTTVHRGHRLLTNPSARRNGNGGRRRRSSLVAQEGTAMDADMVVASWSSGEAGRALRGLVARSWSFHRLRTEDVQRAAMEGMLWEIAGSWAITKEEDGTFEVLMVDASPADAEDIMRALVDLASDRGAERFSVWVADRPWLVEALRSCGCEITPNGVYAQSL